jgi:hypothetical protein
VNIILRGDYRLPQGTTFVSVFNDTNSVTSIASPCEALCFILALALGNFRLSLEECMEFTIFA